MQWNFWTWRMCVPSRVTSPRRRTSSNKACHEISLRAAGAAYRTRLSGSPDDLKALITLAPELANTTYRNLLIDYACAGPKLPRRLVAEAHRIRRN
ncbi:hypothetical protein [Streptomyces flaveolus]|uniref:hypothetical protein n=1 Tax=Streptomyces flaveolus TaxID=67297 RepID=UPI0033C62CA9